MFLLINKPSWYTSYDLIHKIKKLFPRKTKIWHAGTLDPLATGLMLIAIWSDTKKLSQYVGLSKTYLATIDLSQESDTRDTHYRSYHKQLDISTLQMPKIQQIHSLLQDKIWVSRWPLTPFSAKKIAGKKLYEYAREGNPKFIDCDMELLSYEIVSYEFPVLQLRLDVWSGTYIRSIAHWLGSQLWLGGILTALHRESVGERKL